MRAEERKRGGGEREGRMKRPIGASNHEAEQWRDFYTFKQGDVIARPTSYLHEGLKDAYLE